MSSVCNPYEDRLNYNAMGFFGKMLQFILLAMKTNKGSGKQMAEIDQKIEQISLKYRQLKTCQFPIVKVMIIQELRKLAAQITEMMHHYEHPSNTTRRRQIDDVLKKCLQLEKEMEEESKHDIGGGGRHKGVSRELQPIDEAEISKKALQSVIYHEIRTSELKINPKEYDQIYNRMIKNQEVMKDIEMMVKEQGHDLDKIDEYLSSVYDNVSNANQELNEANQCQKTSRRLKFRLAITGFFAALGYKILGLPGLVAGLFTGIR